MEILLFTVDVAGGNVSVGIKVLTLFRELQKASGTIEVNMDGLIKGEVEVDGSGYVDDVVHILLEFFILFRAENESWISLYLFISHNSVFTMSPSTGIIFFSIIS